MPHERRTPTFYMPLIHCANRGGGGDPVARALDCHTYGPGSTRSAHRHFPAPSLPLLIPLALVIFQGES